MGRGAADAWCSPLPVGGFRLGSFRILDFGGRRGRVRANRDRANHQIAHVLIHGRERPELSGRHEVDVEAMAAHIARRAVVEHHSKRLVLGIFDHRGLDIRGFQVTRQRFNRVAVLPEGLVARFAFEQRKNRATGRAAPLDHLQQFAEDHEPLQLPFERFARDLRPVPRTSVRVSAARLIRNASSSRSSLMNVSWRPRLARKSGGWAM